MKSTFLYFLFLVAFTSFCADTAYAVNIPIPGIDIIVRKKPGGSIIPAKTGKDGTCSITIKEGEYTLSVATEKVLEMLAAKGINTKKITLLLTINEGPGDVMVNGKRMHEPFTLSKLEDVDISTKTGGNLTCTLTYETK